MKRLVVDTPNILFRVYSANKKNHVGDNETDAGLAMHMCFRTILSFYKKLKPDQIAFAFEGPFNWRKDYTRSDVCVSGRLYKGNRVKDDSNQLFFEMIDQFKFFVKNHTTAICLQHDKVEGDDMIAGFVQHFAESEDDEIEILSGDKDFTQLLRQKNVKIINPDKNGKPREHDDPEYFIFEKCLRGDSGDNVMSAYPRVRSTKIEKAFVDEFARANLMNETWEIKDPESGEITKTFRVGDLFEENKLLMDLTAQPEEIKQIIKETVANSFNERGSYSYFHFMRFLGKYKLDAIADEAMKYDDMFSLNDKRAQAKKEMQEASSVSSPKIKRAGTIVQF
jgi:hypothetical protein